VFQAEKAPRFKMKLLVSLGASREDQEGDLRELLLQPLKELGLSRNKALVARLTEAQRLLKLKLFASISRQLEIEHLSPLHI